MSAFLKRNSVRAAVAALLVYAGAAVTTGKFDPVELFTTVAAALADPKLLPPVTE